MLFEKLFTLFAVFAVAMATTCIGTAFGKCSIAVSMPKNQPPPYSGTAAVYDPECNLMSHEVHVKEHVKESFKANKSTVDVTVSQFTFNATVHSRSGGETTVTEFQCNRNSAMVDCSAYVSCNLFNRKRSFRA